MNNEKIEKIISILNNQLKQNLTILKKLPKKPTARSLQKYILIDEQSKKYLLEVASNNIEIFYLKRTIEFQKKFSELEHNFKLNMPLYYQIGNKFSFVVYEYFDGIKFLKNHKPVELLKDFYIKNSKEIEINDDNIKIIVSNFLSAWPPMYHSMIKRQKLFRKWIEELKKLDKVKVAFEHGDFNEENIALIQDQVYLLDFEFAKEFQPIGFDIYDYYKLKKLKMPRLENYELHKIKYELIDRINQKIDEDATLEIYDEIDEDATLKKNWEILYKKGANYNLSLEWCETWLKYFKKDNQKLFIFTIWQDDKLVLLAPLYRQKNTLYLIGSEPDLYDSFDILYEDEKYIKYFLSYIFKKGYQINFKYLDSDSIFAKNLIKYLYQNNIKYESKIIDTKPKINLEYFNFKAKEKSDVKRLKNRAVKKYGNELKFYFNSVLNDNIIEQFILMHKERWNGGPFDTLKNLNSFIKELAKKDIIILSRLVLGDEIIAFHLGYVDSKGNLNSIMPAYKKEYKNISPGKVLIYELVDFLKKRGDKVFDFGRGAEEYKYWFSNESSILFHVRTYSRKSFLVQLKMIFNKLMGKILKVIYG